MSEWLKSLVGYMLIVSAAMQMLPNQKYEQYVKLFTGFLLIILVLQPVLKIGAADAYLENKILEFVGEQEHLEEQIGREGEVFLKKTKEYDTKENLLVEIPKVQEVEVMLGD